MAGITEELGQFVADVSLSELPADVVWKAKSCVLYGLAIAMGASDNAGAGVAAAAMQDVDGAPEAGRSTILLSGARVGASDAAFANAVLFNGRNQSDSYRTAAHLGWTVLPSVLAMAERLGSSGREAIEAVVAGYEVAAAIAKEHVN